MAKTGRSEDYVDEPKPADVTCEIVTASLRCRGNLARPMPKATFEQFPAMAPAQASLERLSAGGPDKD